MLLIIQSQPPVSINEMDYYICAVKEIPYKEKKSGSFLPKAEFKLDFKEANKIETESNLCKNQTCGNCFL